VPAPVGAPGGGRGRGGMDVGGRSGRGGRGAGRGTLIEGALGMSAQDVAEHPGAEVGNRRRRSSSSSSSSSSEEDVVDAST
jgi:hypothetical protein